MDEGEGGEDEEADAMSDARTCKDFPLLYGFTFATADLDNLASLLYLGNQLGFTTLMVGDVRDSVDVVVGLGSGIGVSFGINIQDECLLPAFVKNEYSQLFSTFLGNQLGNTIMVGDIQARLWVVVVGCSCGMGVYCGSQCLERGKGWREGFRFAGEDQLQGVAVLEQLNTSGVGGEMADQNSTTGWQQVGSSVPGWVYF